MSLLSLDQASKVTGWSYFKDGELVKYGTFSVSSSLPLGQRLTLFLDNLDTLFRKYNFDEVAFEDIQMQMGNVKTFKMLAMIQAMIVYWCDRQGIVYSILSPSHWRKILKEKHDIQWGKKRQEQKQAAIDFIKKQIGVEVDSDTADSICLGLAHIIENRQNQSAF